MVVNKIADFGVRLLPPESAERQIERRFRKVIREHPEYGDAMDKVWSMLVKYRIPANRWLTDSLFQERTDGRPRDVDVLFYSELVFQLLKGHLFYTGVDVGCPPTLDPKEEFLNELTLAGIKPPFGISYLTKNGRREPWLTWRDPVIVHSHREGQAHATKELPPGSALLTIGYTRAINTGLTLREHRALSRWPHGHSFIYLLWTDVEGLFEGITDLSTWLNDRI